MEKIEYWSVTFYFLNFFNVTFPLSLSALQSQLKSLSSSSNNFCMNIRLCWRVILALQSSSGYGNGVEPAISHSFQGSIPG